MNGKVDAPKITKNTGASHIQDAQKRMTRY